MPSSMRGLNSRNRFVRNRKNVELKSEERKIMNLGIGSSGPLVEVLQESLLSLDFYNSKVDGIFGEITRDAVEDFQGERKIFADGIVGQVTVNEINTCLTAAGLSPIILFPPSVKSSLKTPLKKMRWIKCTADVFSGRGGYGSLNLRSDTAAAYKDLYDDVHSLGGIITTAGGKRSLKSKTSPSRSKKSMHYVGLAFDLALPTGMQNIKTDPYVIEKSGNREWTVWCRTEDPSVPVKTLKGVIAKTRSGKTIIEEKQITDRFFNFTELAEQHGFKPIKARTSFFRGGSYTGAEWWHFQWEKALQKNKSVFGEELLKLYDLQRCESFHYWDEVKNCVFGIDWF